MSYINAINQMTESVLTTVREMIEKNSKCDKTFTVKVINVLSDDKVYVKYCASEYAAFTTIPCSINDIVQVCAPCGILESLYVVSNKTKGKTLRDYVKLLNQQQSEIELIKKKLDDITDQLIRNQK